MRRQRELLFDVARIRAPLFSVPRAICSLPLGYLICSAQLRFALAFSAIRPPDGPKCYVAAFTGNAGPIFVTS